jgi:hypothetical protein
MAGFIPALRQLLFRVDDKFVRPGILIVAEQFLVRNRSIVLIVSLAWATNSVEMYPALYLKRFSVDLESLRQYRTNLPAATWPRT